MSELAVRLEGISKRYGAREALSGASLEVRKGEVHAVVGENGAGKSTLMKVLYGMVTPDRGVVEIAGRATAARHSPASAIALGVGMVHQHFMLVPTLTVWENVLLGAEPRKGPLVDRASAIAQVSALAQRAGFQVDPQALVESLSVGEQQRVEILKLLARGAQILILDEPTAVLTPKEAEDLFRVVRGLVDDGHTAIVVTHKLDEVTAAADRVTVLRGGATVASFEVAKVDKHVIARAMFEGDVPLETRGDWSSVAGKTRLAAVDVRAGRALQGVSFEIAAGEVLGVAGVEGNGQTELVEVLTGLRHPDDGEVLLDGQTITDATVAARRGAGLAHIPEDCHRRAMVLELSVAENLILGHDADYGAVVLDRPRIHDDAAQACAAYGVRPADPEALAGDLSGGNQQKVVVARELGREPIAIICAHPTRGVDLSASALIHARILEARARGAAVLLLSSELSELRALSDRIIVLYRGKVAATLAVADASIEALGQHMTGGAG